jgi:hypothetical protein
MNSHDAVKDCWRNTLIITILLLNMAASGLQITADQQPLLTRHTSRSVHEFSSCFMASQEKQSRPLWAVPHEDGIRISNAGASGVTNPYLIRFTERDGRNRLAVFMQVRDQAEERALDQAISRCS